jgi:hypothetical protein
MIFDASMIKQGWTNGKAIFFSQAILPLTSIYAGREALGTKKPRTPAGLKNLETSISEK